MDAQTNIFIVEDDLHSQAILGLMLREARYRLMFAQDGTKALAKLRDFVPDLVLLDVMLPGELNGFDICRRLRADGRLSAVPVIMVTARGDTQARLEAMQAGADDFVTKPYNRLELQNRIDAVTRFYRYRQLLFKKENSVHDTDAVPPAAEESADKQPAAGVPRATSLENLIATLAEQVHELAFDLQPVMLSEVGLLPVLNWHFQRFQAQTGIHVDFEQRGMSQRPAPVVETAVYRVVQVALINAARHAHVERIWVDLRRHNDHLHLHIWDEGDDSSTAEALARYQSGLTHLKQLAQRLQGTVAVTFEQPRGAVLTAQLPFYPDSV